jgi:Bifunctional DNA primase/polymerase, N-terminal
MRDTTRIIVPPFSRLGQAALAYLQMRWVPIPLCWPDPSGRCGCPKRHTTPKAIGKAPLLDAGYESVRPTRLDLRTWWRTWPQANIGLLLEPSGLLVVDCDSRAAIHEAEALGLPPGPVVTSGKGRHYYYQASSDVTGRTTKRGVSKGIDILAKGYVVAPPSRHASGRSYQWVVAPLGVP